MIDGQNSKRAPFTFERIEGKTPGTVIFRFCGAFTAHSMFECLPPVALRNLLDFHSTPNDQLPKLNILDLTNVPYMDSTGMGMIVSHYVHCQGKGIQFVAAGSSPRVLELFRITKVDGVLPLVATVEEAEAS
jgi:anti-anti-sigma factor